MQPRADIQLRNESSAELPGTCGVSKGSESESVSNVPHVPLMFTSRWKLQDMDLNLDTGSRSLSIMVNAAQAQRNTLTNEWLLFSLSTLQHFNFPSALMKYCSYSPRHVSQAMRHSFAASHLLDYGVIFQRNQQHTGQNLEELTNSFHVSHPTWNYKMPSETKQELSLNCTITFVFLTHTKKTFTHYHEIIIN